MSQNPSTSDSLAADLRRLGVEDGDVVMVHASLRAVGPVEGRAAALIAALDAAVGPSGTTLMVLGAHDDWSWVNAQPESERARLLVDALPFDALSAPAEADLGMLAELYRREPGTLVNDHPEGRFAARGARAAELICEPPWHDYYGPGSPLERLVRAQGKVLRLGADLNTVTLLHYAEYLAVVPNKRRVRRHRLVRQDGGVVVRVVECLDDSEGIVDYPGQDYFALILRSYLASGHARCGRVGQAPSELLDAGHLVQFASDWMSQHLSR